MPTDAFLPACAACLSVPRVTMRRAVCDRLLNLASSVQGTRCSSGTGCSHLPSGLRQAWLWAGPESSGGLPCDSGNPSQRRPALRHWQGPPCVACLVQDLNLGPCPGKASLLQGRASSPRCQGRHRVIVWEPGAHYLVLASRLNTTVRLQSLIRLLVYDLHRSHTSISFSETAVLDLETAIHSNSAPLPTLCDV